MDQSLVNSGFDVELLIGGRYIAYMLLSFSETGSMPLKVPTKTGFVDIFQPGNVDRLYDPHPDAVPVTASDDSFRTELIFGHPTGANVRVDVEVLVQGQFLSAFSSFTLIHDTDSQGNQTNHRLRIEVLSIELTPGLQAALAAAGMTEAELLAQVKDQVDRDVPLPFIGAGSDVASVALRQLPSLDGGPVAIGVYLNLKLRNGGNLTDFLPDRGDIFAGMNFLEEGQDVAFAVRDGFFKDLSAHQKFLFAEPKNDGSGEFRFPLRREMFDPTSEQIGQLFSVTIGPGINPQNGQLTGEISVKIRGEYFVDNFFDPDFTFTLTLVPNFDDGVITWSHKTDLSSDLAAILSFLVAGFVGLIGYAIASDIAADALVDEDQRQQMSRFLESLPVRVPTELLRWDPFYLTKHQIVARVDEWIVNGKGIAFSGRAALGKETEPVDHVVLRTEFRNSLFEILRYEYRVRDQARHTFWLDQSHVFSATDRLTYIQNTTDPVLFGLTDDEIVARLDAKKIIGRQDLLPKKVHLDDHKIFRMLCITPLEVKEQIRIVEDNFKRETRTQISNDQGTALREEARVELEAELGMPPTQQQINERFQQKLDALVKEAFDAYKESAQYEQDVEAAVDSILRLDMAPNEYGLLQRRGILQVVGFDLIERHNRKFRPGTTILYYRDRPDFDPRDNLLNMLKYAVDHAAAPN
jgi:hypothetical protein